MAISNNQNDVTLMDESGNSIQYARIQMRRGLESQFNVSKMLPAEFAVTTDTEKVHVAFSPGKTKQLMTVDDALEEVQEKADEILATLPEDYTHLEEKVSSLSEEKLDKYKYNALSVVESIAINDGYAVGLNGAAKISSGESVARYPITSGKTYRITGKSDTTYALFAQYTAAAWANYIDGTVFPNTESENKNVIFVAEPKAKYVFISRGTYEDIKLEEIEIVDILTTVPTDKTLEKENVPADSKAVGDELRNTQNLVGEKVAEYFEEHPEIGDVQEQFRDKNTNIEYGEELLSDENVTIPSGWSGDMSQGFTHNNGTDPLSFDIQSIETEAIYALTITASNGRIDGYSDFTVSLCGSEEFETYKGGGDSQTYNFGMVCGSDGTNRLVINPGETYNGTLTGLSLKKIISLSVRHTSVYANSGGIDCSEFRLNGFDNDLLCIGLYSGQKNFFGEKNTAIGKESLSNNTDGFWNTAVGYNTMKNNIHGTRNVAIGFIALQGCETGDRNIAIGTFAMEGLKSGRNNVAIGADAMQTGNGSGNIAIGTGSGGKGNFNTSVGYRAGNAVSGKKNVFIGWQAGDKSTTGGGNIIIGSETQLDNPSDSNVTLIGRKNTKMTRVYGDFQVQGADGIKRKIIFNEDGTCSWEKVQ